MEKEFIAAEPEDKDAWLCVCKNTPCGDGFYPCDFDGKLVEPTEAEWKSGLYVCFACGRMINPDTLKVVGHRSTPIDPAELA